MEISTINLRLREQFRWLAKSVDLIDSRPLARPAGLLSAAAGAYTGPDVTARRLGIQFEQLVRYYLENIAQVSDIETNIPIREDKITLGEADLLFRFQRQWWHLELALKFYLREVETEGLAGYYGPNRKDRFDIKWRHMVEHQSQIFSKASAQPLLEQRGVSCLKAGLLVKGWLFQHPNDQRTTYPEPINPHHARGWWIHQSELRDWLRSQPSTARFMLVEKPLWLYPAARVPSPCLNAAQVINRLRGRYTAVQIWVVLGEGWSRQLLSRGYVVGDDWGRDEA